MIRLAALYVCWDDWELLDQSVRIMKPLVEGLVIVGSWTSNYGEESFIPYWKDPIERWEPNLRLPPSQNERAKRNYGLEILKQQGYTHFVMLDADEVYEPEAFLKVKALFEENTDLLGSVCASQVYFKIPTLTIGLDTTRVPFIHKITPELQFESTNRYPYAYEDGIARIDPTRRLNITEGVYFSSIVMHHFSYVRKDLKKKIRNSTAAKNLEKSTVIEDYKNAKDGYFCQMYGKTLQNCDNIFNIPEIIDNSL